jgi:hypothetical protein
MNSFLAGLLGALSVFASSAENDVDSLASVSIAKQLLKQGSKPGQIVFGLTIDEEGKIAANKRDVISFRFKVRPAEKSKTTNKKGQLTLLSVLDADSVRGFLISLLITDNAADVHEEAQIGRKLGTKPRKVDVFLVRKESEEPSIKGRAAVAKLWNLLGESIHAKYEDVSFEAIVLGTGLSHNEKMGTFANPGSGSWALLRIYGPGEAFLALNLDSGEGQLFPKSPGIPDPVGKALFRLF